MQLKIPLTQDKYAIIDKGDFLLVSKYKWYYRKSGKTNGKNGYAQHSKYVKGSFDKEKRYGKHISIFMHNLIMNPKKDMQVDHIDRNGLNNTRSNLRVVTKSQNYANFSKKKNTRSKYRGVGFLVRKNGKEWQSSTSLNGKCVYIGVYKTEKEAALAYNKFAKKVFGKCAQLNKI